MRLEVVRQKPKKAHSTKSTRRVPGPRSKDRIIVDCDKRTRVGRIFRTIKQDLIEHCGGNPSVAKRAIIENAALLQTRIHLVSERILSGDDMVAGEAEKINQWMNTLIRQMQALGLEPAMKDVTPPSLDQYLAVKSQTVEGTAQ